MFYFYYYVPSRSIYNLRIVLTTPKKAVLFSLIYIITDAPYYAPNTVIFTTTQFKLINIVTTY